MGVSIQTAKEREEAFRRDLTELLLKHRAELIITDDGKGYGMHSCVVEVMLASELDAKGNLIAEYAEFQI